jgi:hypothetical protein
MSMDPRGGLALACLLLPCLAHAAPLYSLTPIDLGNPEWNLYPMSINDRGEVAGFIDRDPRGTLSIPDRPFAWYGTGLARELLVPAGTTQRVTANAINNRGEVLGWIGNDTVIWSADGGVRAIAPPAGHTLVGSYAMNDAGTILSVTSQDGGRSRSVLRRRADGSVQEGRTFFPNAVNQHDAAVGGAGGDPAVAVVWEADGSFRSLPSPGSAHAYDINDAGWVSGKIVYGDLASLAVWRPDGSLIVVPVPGINDDDYATGFGINNRGEVVGIGFHNAMYWSEAEGVVDLQTRLDASGAGWRLGWATGINDAGQIIAVATHAGAGNRIHSVLLTPVPEPSMPLAGIVVAAALAMRHRVR